MEKQVICRTKEEYDQLMRIYEAKGWKWCRGQSPTKYNAWDGRAICIDYHDRFTWEHYAMFAKIMTFEEFLEFENLPQSIYLPNSISLPTTMSIRDTARNLLLSKKERTLRKLGLKDDKGHWTQEAREVYLEQIMNNDKTAFDDLIKELDDK